MKKVIKEIFVFPVLFLLPFTGCKSKPETKPAEPPVVHQYEKAETVEDNGAEELNTRLENAEKNAEKARQTAFENKADTNYSAQFKYAEIIFEEAKKGKTENKLISAGKFEEAEIRYKTLVNLALAAEARNEADTNGFAGYAAETYAEAERFYLNTFDHYEIDYSMAFSSSEDCLKLYKKVNQAGYLEWSKTAKASAEEAKTDCDSVKASKSMTKDYNLAVRAFNEANAAFSEKDYKKSYEGYNASYKSFSGLYQIVSKKRAEAEQALARTREKQNESFELALEADKEAPLEENAAGFENTEIDLSSLEIIESGNTEEVEEIKESVSDENGDDTEDGNSGGMHAGDENSGGSDEESEGVTPEGE